VLAVRVELTGTAAHGSTPWLGDNAILKAYDAFRRVERLPFSCVSSDLFDRPSINLARIGGGDAFNKVPDACWMDIDIRYLPGQDPEAIAAEIRGIPDLEITRRLHRMPATVSRANPYVQALGEAAGRTGGADVLTVGRDGASDAISFLAAGVPAVEFGPVGEGHHGPAEWVSLSSLEHYRRALRAFVADLGAHFGAAPGPTLRAVDGGRA
jgi:succinyl-diaminopimelate desuccinylase